jgi:hypothetical protein
LNWRLLFPLIVVAHVEGSGCTPLMAKSNTELNEENATCAVTQR